MKKLFLIILITCYGFNVKAQNVNIPVANFKAELVSNAAINTNGDGEIQVSEASAYSGKIDVGTGGISSLTGIESFTAIDTLICDYNFLTSLNVSANTALVSLDCGQNPITSLTVSGATNLTNLNCYNNQLSILDVTSNTALSRLECSSNQLTDLDISSNSMLTFFNCNGNLLTVLDVTANSALVELDCASNQLTNLNISSNTTLVNLYCYNNQITSLDFATNLAIVFISCSSNNLTSLDVSANTNLIDLFCYSNQLNTLNVNNGNNTNFGHLITTSNPNLTCIQVDDPTYSNTASYWFKDATASYNENCTTGITEILTSTNISIYPNPSNGSASISYSLNNTTSLNLEVYNAFGEKIADLVNEEQDAGEYEYKFTPPATGIYFLKLQSEKGAEVKKLICTK